MSIESTETLSQLALGPQMIASISSSVSESLQTVIHALTSRQHSSAVRTAVGADVGSGWKSRYNSVPAAKRFRQNVMLLYDSAELSGVKGEEDRAQHSTFTNSTRRRSFFRKWLVYCDMLGSLSQVWIKPLMSCAGNARLNIQARQENFLVSGVECSTKIQESEKHPVTATCTAQDVIKDTKFGSRTTVSWAVCWLEFSRMSCWFKWETNCSATTRSKSLETYKEGSKLDDSFCTVFFFSPVHFSSVEAW